MFGSLGSLVWENYPAYDLSGGAAVGCGDKSATITGSGVESVNMPGTSVKNVGNTRNGVRNVSTWPGLTAVRSSSEGPGHARRECTICGKSVSKRYFEQHVERHGVERKHSCGTCDRAFKTRGDLWAHHKIHIDAGDMYECELCGKKFKTKDYLLKHEVVHNARIHKCLLCGNAFHTQRLLISHQQNMHPSLSAGIRSTSAEGCSVTTRSCPVLERSSTRSACVEHSATGKENTGEELSETISGCYSMSTPYSYQASCLSGVTVVDCNSVGGRAIGAVGVEAADTSEAVFRDVDNEKYRGNNVGEQSGSATIQTFHYNDKRKQCDICGIILSRSRLLSEHKKRYHIDARPYVCGICYKSFKVERDLVIHEAYVHSDDRPFSCTTCGRSFKRKSELTNHKATHKDSKNIKCQYCGRCFKAQRYLSAHRSIVHPGESSYKCHLCPKVFQGICRLKKHLALHHQDPRIDEYSHYGEAARSGNESAGCAQKRHHHQQTGAGVASADAVFVTNQSLPVIKQPSTSGDHIDESEIRWKRAESLNGWRDTLLDLSLEELDHMFR